ncbi:hypothetical protein FM113_06815 [Leucobacter sp. 7(1)]|uniref:hypothetical protein n=1 Tax=Leucobacter sp. 7(1) TaxID=1255613 RepID=UPI00097EB608|nr:hypothetical protein [Leucobacter sp. 7(1)]SJN09644.1 hypothetical protein FM113_06815 [Leucobacter sp. 7(1)]
MTEAWLLADTVGFAEFFSISQAKLTRNPEELAHAKQEVLRVCAGSRKRHVREGMTAGNGEVGPLYVSMINEFASEHWDVHRAMDQSPSLARAVSRIAQIAQ